MKDKKPKDWIVEGKFLPPSLAKEILEKSQDDPEILKRLSPAVKKRVLELAEDKEGLNIKRMSNHGKEISFITILGVIGIIIFILFITGIL